MKTAAVDLPPSETKRALENAMNASDATPPRGRLRVYLRSAVALVGPDPVAIQRASCLAFVTEQLPARYGRTLAWEDREEYIDLAETLDGAGMRRPAMKLLLEDTGLDDVIVMRDLSRISGDSDEVRSVLHALVQERGARVFCYALDREAQLVGSPRDRAPPP